MTISENVTVKKNGNGAGLGFEEKLWLAADKMRGHVESSEYKHIVLGLIFLKYISDVFQERYRWLDQQHSPNPESRAEYREHGIFWIPEKARWSYLESQAKSDILPELMDSAMMEIEEANPELKGILPKQYARLSLESQRLGELLLLIGTIGLGDRENRAKDILGRVYEYFLGRFAYAEGKGGEFYTPPSVVRLLVEMVEPYKGSVYDPCCGSGGMFVQSEKFVLAHGGKVSDLSISGQELNPTTWRLCKMNLALRGIQADLGSYPADSFHHDLHPKNHADFILANPPFNISDWGGERLRKDTRWRYGVPPSNNANFAWIQHIIHHLTPSGVAAFVLTNGSLSASQEKVESNIRQAIIQADLVDCIIALPASLFYNTQIATCVWILAKDKQSPHFRDRRNSTLFIYAQHLGHMVYLAYWLKANRIYLERVANGSTYPELYKNDLFEFEIAVPSLEEQDAILSVISALQYVSLLGLPLEQSATTAEEMIRMQAQNRRLSSIRDAILPMLLSGTLPVSKIKTRFSEAINDVGQVTTHSLWSEQVPSSLHNNSGKPLKSNSSAGRSVERVSL